MSATTAFLLALAAFLAAVADIVRNDGFIDRTVKAVTGVWRRRRPLPQTPAEAAAAQDVVIDGRIVDLKEHVRILKDLVDTANAASATSSAAAAAATRAAEAAEESAAAARQSARAATLQLERWHQWAVRWWPVLRADAERLGVPDPPAIDHTLEEGA